MFIESTNSVNAQTTPTFPVTRGVGQPTNLLVAFQMTILSAGSAPATPTNWTLLAGRLTSGTSDLCCFYKVISGDSGSYTFNNAGGGGSPFASVWVLSINGAAAAPENNATNNTGTGTTATATGITAVNAGDLALAAFSLESNAGETITTQAPLTDIGTLSDTHLKLDAAWNQLVNAGASGNFTATISGSKLWGALLVLVPPAALAPAVGGGGGDKGGFSDGPIPPNRPTNRPASRRTGLRQGRGGNML